MTKGSEQGANPSVNFFFNDWAGGTSILSRHQKGCFMDLLHAQFNNGHLSLDEIKTVLGSDFSAWNTLQKKFVTDEKGLYYNKRLEAEILKKKNYSQSRKENAYGAESSAHMGNGNGLGNDLEKRKENFKHVVFAMSQYPADMLKEFFEYWAEHKPGGRKMRWEMEKVFDIGRRLRTWQKNSEEHEASKNKFHGASQGKFPNYFDANLYAKLGAGSDMGMLQKYQAHLRSIGYRFINQEWTRQAN